MSDYRLEALTVLILITNVFMWVHHWSPHP